MNYKLLQVGGWLWKNAIAIAAQQRATKPSTTMDPKNTGLASFSFSIHLETIGAWDA